MNGENRKKIASSLMVLLMVLSILTAMLPLVNAENVTIWGSVRDASLNPIDGANVTLVNVHTLKEYHAVTSDGLYEFTPEPGYYTIDVKANGYFSQKLETPIRFDGTETIRENFNLNPTPATDRTFYGSVVIKSSGANLSGASVQVIAKEGVSAHYGTYPEVIGMNITDVNGTFSIPVWNDIFEVQVSADGYYTNLTTVLMNDTNTAKNWTINMTEANTVHGYVYVTTDSGVEPAKNIHAYLYNTSTKKLYSTSSSSYYYSFNEGVSAGSYLLIIDADGGVAYTSMVDVNDSTTPLPDASGEVTLAQASGEKSATTITLRDWNNITLKNSLMLNSDGDIEPLGNDVSNLWLQIDMKFGNGDAKINQTEINAFSNWYNSIGPEFVTTADFFSVNGTSYISDANLTNYSVSIEPSVSGEVNVTEMGKMWINTTALYTSASNIGDQNDYHATLMAAQDTVAADTIDNTYEIDLPDGFELVDNTNSEVSGYTTISIDPATGEGTDTVTMTFEKSVAPEVYAVIEDSDAVYSVMDNGTLDHYIVKAGSEITLSASGTTDPNGNPVSYSWDFGDGNSETTTEMEINHTYASGEDITVTLTATDAGGLSNTTTFDVMVDATAPTVSATSSIAPVGGVVYADQSEQIVFNSSTSSDNSGFIDSYFWWFGDNNSTEVLSGENQSVIKSFEDVGVYNVYLNVTDVVGNYRNASVFKVQINDTEGPKVSFAVLDESFNDAAGSVKENTTAYFNASATTDNMDDASALTFVWDFGDGSNATGMNVSHMYTATGSYDVNLTVTDSAGNTNSLVKTVVVRAANRPDLSIVSVNFEPTQFEQGSTGKIIVNITNNGDANASSVKVTAYTVDIDGNEKEIGSTTTITLNGTAVSQLETGKIATAEIDWKPAETGNFTIKVVVSTPNELSGTSANNVYKDVVSVSPSTMQTMLVWIILLVLIVLVLVLVIFKDRLSSIKVGGKKK